MTDFRETVAGRKSHMARKKKHVLRCAAFVEHLHLRHGTITMPANFNPCSRSFIWLHLLETFAALARDKQGTAAYDLCTHGILRNFCSERSPAYTHTFSEVMKETKLELTCVL